MAQYKHGQYLDKSDNAAYDAEHAPGSEAENAGIYQCTGCHDEIALPKGHRFPPQNTHQHTNNSPIRWRLLVFAQQKK